MNAQVEGDEIPDDNDKRPDITVVLYGKSFAQVAQEGLPRIAATGTSAVKTLATLLLQAGFDSERPDGPVSWR